MVLLMDSFKSLFHWNAWLNVVKDLLDTSFICFFLAHLSRQANKVSL